MRRCSSRLRLPALGGGDDEQAGVDAADAGEHVAQEPHVAGHVDEADRRARRQRRVGEAEVDRRGPAASPPRSRSGSVPVSASTSDDLPWSTWPAVATTLIGRSAVGAARRARLDDDVVVGRVDGAEVEAASRRRGRAAMTGRSWARSAARWSPATRHAGRRHRRRRAPSRRRAARPSPAARRRAPTLADDRASPGRAQLVDGRGDHPPERDRRRDVAAEVGERDVLQRGEHEPAGAQRAGQRMPRRSARRGRRGRR